MSDVSLSESDRVSSGRPSLKETPKQSEVTESGDQKQPISLARPNINNPVKVQQFTNIHPDIEKGRNIMGASSFNNSRRGQPDDKANRTLALMHKNLCRLPPNLIEKISSLRILDLSHNNFEYFPLEVTHITPLQILRFNYNRIKRVPAEISKLENLEILSFSHNRLHDLPSTLTQIPTLKGLHLESNLIESFGSEITNIASLECLNIYHNKLSYLPTSFKNLKKLKDLRFEWLRYLGSPSCYWREADGATGLNQLREGCEKLWSNNITSCSFLDFLKMFAQGREICLTNRDQNGCTILHQACLAEDIGVMKYLISAIPELLDLPDNQNRTPLYLSILKDKYNSCSYLLKHGANPTKHSNTDGTPLHVAVQRLNREVVRGILRLGEKANRVDADGNTPLHYAISLISEDPERATEIIEDLLDFGADLNIKNKEGWAPFHLAVRKRDTKAIEWGLGYNLGTMEVCGRNDIFDINMGGGPHNWTPMHIAAYSENPELVEMLGEAGVCMFEKSLNGYTPKRVVGKPGLVQKLVIKYERRWIKDKILANERFISMKERLPTQAVKDVSGKKRVQNVSRNLFASNFDFGDNCTEFNDQIDYSDISSNNPTRFSPFNHRIKHLAQGMGPVGAIFNTRVNVQTTMTETKHLRKKQDDSSEILPESDVNTLSHSLEDGAETHPDFCGAEVNEDVEAYSEEQNKERKVLPTKDMKNKLSDALARIAMNSDQNNYKKTISFNGYNNHEKEEAFLPLDQLEAYEGQKYEIYLKNGVRIGFSFYQKQAHFLEQLLLKEEATATVEKLKALSAIKLLHKVIVSFEKNNFEVFGSKESSKFVMERSYSLQFNNSHQINRSELAGRMDKYFELVPKVLENVLTKLKSDISANVIIKVHICRILGDIKALRATEMLQNVIKAPSENILVRIEAKRIYKLLEIQFRYEMEGQFPKKDTRNEIFREKKDGIKGQIMLSFEKIVTMPPPPVKKIGIFNAENLGR